MIYTYLAHVGAGVTSFSRRLIVDQRSGSGWRRFSPLAESFWGDFILGWAFAAIVATVILKSVPFPDWVVSTVSLLIYFGYPCWAAVRVWRSANAHASKRVWRLLAKGCVVYTLVCVAAASLDKALHAIRILTSN